MAAGKGRRLKLQIDTRTKLDIERDSKADIRTSSMASAPDQSLPSPMDNAPNHISPLDQPVIASLHSQQPMSRASASLAAARRRRSSKGPMSSSLKRSASTPNVRGLIAPESSMSLADKRRNKLGYHRTSVACGRSFLSPVTSMAYQRIGHCRRRKIRCLLALDDPQNRCSNCIRLKKECCFFPVDQQPSMDRRPRTGSKAGSGETSASSSSSPAMTGGPVVDFAQFHPLPLSNQEYPPSAPPLSTTTSSPSRRASENSRTYEFSYHHDRSHWESPFYDHAPTSAGNSTPEDPSHPYWRLGESPVTPAFQQFSGPPGPPNSLVHHAFEPRSSFAAFNSPREDAGWPPAPRSMSFGHVEDLSHGYPHPYSSPMSMDYRRRPSELYPPSLQTSSNNSTHNSSGEILTPPMSAPVTSQPMAHFVSPAWNSLPGHSAISKGPEYSAWYSEPAPLAKVQEEEILPSFNHGPGPVYTTVG
ncbi:MAG: hypothetical protein LQ337_004808 [Flavoplaca oasis]|nr:MAG: hypothetical protein LQ337_004808 [Flavoplaca oasis]